MKYYLLIVKFLFILIITWSIACKKNSTSTKNKIWKAIGFEDKLAIRLVLSEPYLYICAGSNGLWRLNIRDSGNYQCLGLIDTSLGNYYNRGVQDVLIHPDNPDWLLVSFLPDKGKDHGVFSSIDVGNTWKNNQLHRQQRNQDIGNKKFGKGDRAERSCGNGFVKQSVAIKRGQ